MENAEIARVLEDTADLLEIGEANPFRIRAYRVAAQTLRAHPVPAARMMEESLPLTSLPGIGKDMAGKIAEIQNTGTLSQYEELAREYPPTLIGITRLNGLGPKSARALWSKLGIRDLAGVEEAARAGRIAGLPGFGEKTQARILASIAELKSWENRIKLSDADRIVEPLLAYLRACPGVERAEVAGSSRRRRDTIGDIDLLACARDSAPVMEAFLRYPRVQEVRGSGGTRGTVVLDTGLQVDLRVVPEESWGAALVYFTGSKDHDIRLRRRAIDQGLKISEYGVFREETAIAGASEDEVYAAVGLPWIPPEIRENAGEIEAAEQGSLPRLIRLEDLRGDLHTHSTWSDGRNSVEEMCEASIARGYEYFAVTDHSKTLAMIGGLDSDRLRRQWDEIREVQARHPEIRILRGLEVDILLDGKLDLEDELLAELDIVVVSVHSRFDLPEDVQTERILRAIRHPETNILAHPSARQINRRAPIRFDFDAVLRCARENGVAMEVNCQPDRLDLRDADIRRARDKGVPVVISTDSHRCRELEHAGYGVDQARRGWCEAADVINTRPLAGILGFLSKEAVSTGSVATPTATTGTADKSVDKSAAAKTAGDEAVGAKTAAAKTAAKSIIEGTEATEATERTERTGRTERTDRTVTDRSVPDKPVSASARTAGLGSNGSDAGAADRTGGPS